MTVTATETSHDSSNDKDSTSLTISYVILDSATATALTATDALGVLPALSATTTVSTIVLKAKSRSVKVVADSAGRIWEGTVLFDDSGDDSDFVASDLSTNVATVDFWRAGASAPASYSSPTAIDIGGTPVDSGGEPVSFLIAQQEITVTNYSATNNAANCLAGIGTRNSTSILGSGAGFLVFSGASARRVKKTKYEIQYKFTHDTFAHLRQAPARDLTGGVERNTPSASGDWTAKTVYWKQPIPITSNFANLGISFP